MANVRVKELKKETEIWKRTSSELHQEKNLYIDGFIRAKAQSLQTEGKVRHRSHLLTAAKILSAHKK